MERWVVDVSEWDPSPEDMSFALSVLPPSEQSSVTRYWCLKEAFVKATGSGLADDLDKLEFHHSGWENISVNIEGKAMSDWRFWLQELGKNHLVSIARGHPRSASGSYMRTLRQTEFDEKEFYAALHLPNVGFVSRTVEQLTPVSHKAPVHHT